MSNLCWLFGFNRLQNVSIVCWHCGSVLIFTPSMLLCMDHFFCVTNDAVRIQLRGTKTVFFRIGSSSVIYLHSSLISQTFFDSHEISPLVQKAHELVLQFSPRFFSIKLEIAKTYFCRLLGIKDSFPCQLLLLIKCVS